MNVQAEKYKLIEWITSLEDNSIIELLKSIQTKTASFSSELSDEEKQIIAKLLQQSESEIREGQIHVHENVMEEIRERYGINKQNHLV